MRSDKLSPEVRQRSGMAWVVLLLLLSIYLLTYGQTILSGDGWAMFATAESILRRGSLDMDQLLWMGLQQGTPGPDGHLYSRKGLAVPLLALPLIWLGLKIPWFGLVKAALLLNALVIAGWGALTYRLCRELGYSKDAALATSLLLGLTTPAWAYAKSFFSEPLIGLGLLGCVYFLVQFERTHRWWKPFAAGAMYGLALTAKTIYVAFLPLVIILMAMALGVKPSDGGTGGMSPHRLKTQARLWGAFFAPQALAVLLILAYNYLRYGSPFTTGYLPQESFSAVWWQGILGLTVSPGKGLIWYAPVLLALPLTWASFYRRHKPLSLFIALLTLANVLLFGKWFMWHGGHSWGPRFLIPLLPLLVIPLAEGWRTSRLRKVLVGLGIAGFIIQVPGISVPFGLHQEALQAQGLPLYAPETFFNPRYSPLLRMWRFLRPENLNFAWMGGGRVDVLALLISIAWCGLMGWLLLSPLPLPSPLHGKSILLALAVLATSLLLARYDTKDVPSSLRDVLRFISQREQPGQAFINPMPEWSRYVSDAYKGHLPVYGLRDGYIDPPPETGRWLGRLIKQYEGLWLLQCPFPPELSGIERPLMAFGYRVLDRDFSGIRLALYQFPKRGLIRRDARLTFGEAISLESYAFLPEVSREGAILAELRWRALRQPDGDYQVSLLLIDGEGNVVIRKDEGPAMWTRPTSSWQPGEEIIDRHGFLVPEALSPGKYKLVVRLYNPESGKALSTESGEEAFKLGEVHILR